MTGISSHYETVKDEEPPPPSYSNAVKLYPTLPSSIATWLSQGQNTAAQLSSQSECFKTFPKQNEQPEPTSKIPSNNFSQVFIVPVTPPTISNEAGHQRPLKIQYQWRKGGNLKCFKALISFEMVLGAVLLFLGAASVALCLTSPTPVAVYDFFHMRLPERNPWHRAPELSVGIWGGVICLTSAAVGLASILKPTNQRLQIGHMIMALSGMISCAIVFAFSIIYLGYWQESPLNYNIFIRPNDRNEYLGRQFHLFALNVAICVAAGINGLCFFVTACFACCHKKCFTISYKPQSSYANAQPNSNSRSPVNESQLIPAQVFIVAKTMQDSVASPATISGAEISLLPDTSGGNVSRIAQVEAVIPSAPLASQSLINAKLCEQ